MAHSLVEPLDLTATVDVNFNRKVASGGYGDVYKGRLTRNVDGHSGEVAVKVTRFIFTDVPETVLKALKQELDIWQRHRHPYILPLIGVYLYQDVPCAVSPWCDRGTIIQYMKSARGGHEPELDAPVTDCDFDLLRLHCLEMKLLSEVAGGLTHLHGYNMAHGDIKPSNILVKKGGVAQLGDFGFSVILAERSSNTSSHLGTARWFAPESLQDHAHRTQEADVWAFGCVILEVRTLLVPYHRVHDRAVPLAILKDSPFERPENIHPSLWSIAEACWSRSPEGRIPSPTLASRMKTTFECVTVFRKALSHLPDVQALDLDYPNSKSTSQLSLDSAFPMTDNARSFDLTLAVATARNALRALEASGKRYPPAALRAIHGITSPAPAKQPTPKLSSRASPERLGRPLRGHTSIVYSVSFLQDGRRLVSSSYDRTLRIWDVETGQTVIGPLKGHTNTVSCVAVHGSRIASCSWDATFRIWDADSGTLVLGPIQAHNGKELTSIVYSRDGTRIATAGDDNRAAIWDANTGVQLHDMIGHTQEVWCVVFSEGGTRLVSGSADRTIRIWDVASGECIGEPLMGHTDLVRALCFSPDETRIFSASDDCTIRTWDAETRALIGEPMRMDNWVLCMALSPDGKCLVSGSRSGKSALWVAETGVPTPFNNHRDMVWGVAFSSDGRTIASASADHTVALLDVDNWRRNELGYYAKHAASPELPGSPLRGHTAAVYSAAFLPDGRRLVSASVDKALRIWDVETGKTVIGPLEGHTNIVRCVAVHNLRIASCSYDGTFRVWDSDSGKLVLGPIIAHQGKFVESIAYSRDGTRIATAGRDDRVAIWDANTAVQFCEMIGHTRIVMCAVFSEDGRRLVSSGCDKTIRVWDAMSGMCIGEPLTGHTSWVRAVCFSPDDKRIFSSSDDRTIRIWDAEMRALIGESLRMDGWVLCMALSPDGKRLVSGSQYGKIAMWDAETGAAVPTSFKDHKGYVWSVAFSPDGRTIASASDDKTIALWDATDDWKRWDIDDEDVEKDGD